MKSHATFARLLISCGLAAVCASAAADINRCQDEQGHLLLSDRPCEEQNLTVAAVRNKTVVMTETQSMQSADAVALSPEAPQLQDGADKASGKEVLAIDVQAPPAELKSSPWATLPHPLPRRSVMLDISTLQAARGAMLMEDEMRRQRKVANR